MKDNINNILSNIDNLPDDIILTWKNSTLKVHINKQGILCDEKSVSLDSIISKINRTMAAVAKRKARDARRLNEGKELVKMLETWQDNVLIHNTPASQLTTTNLWIISSKENQALAHNIVNDVALVVERHHKTNKFRLKAWSYNDSVIARVLASKEKPILWAKALSRWYIPDTFLVRAADCEGLNKTTLWLPHLKELFIKTISEPS